MPIRTTIQRPLFIAVVLYIVVSLVLGAQVLTVPGFISTDDYYHARIADELLEQRTLEVNFPWLPQTILSPDRFVDHHLLFHLYVSPWMHWGGLVGAKFAAVSLAAAVIVVAWVLLRHLSVPVAWVWALTLLAVSGPFIYRLLMVRAQGMALLVLIIALLALFTGKYRALIAIAFSFTWLYNGFVLIIGVAAAYTIASWISDRKFDLRPLFYTLAGVILGLIINPYFPHNITFIAEHLGAKIDLGSSVQVGNEWYPYSTAGLLENSGGALIALALGLVLPGIIGHKRDVTENTLLFMTLLTLYMTFESRRFIEYFPAFAALFGTVSVVRSAHALISILPVPLMPLAVSRITIPAAFVLIAVSTSLNLRSSQELINRAPHADYLAGAANWLEQNTPSDSMIFQTDWDDFTRLFFHNTHNHYLIGLDPTYLERANVSLWDRWVEITQGKVDEPSTEIQRVFGASYVVSDTRHRAFEKKAEEDPNMRLVYRDQFNLIWEITLKPLVNMEET